MGVCEGLPGSVMPDHNGRADYLGHSVNQAARFMDAGEECQFDLSRHCPESTSGCGVPCVTALRQQKRVFYSADFHDWLLASNHVDC